MTDLNRLMATAIMEWREGDGDDCIWWMDRDGYTAILLDRWNPLFDESQTWQCLEKAMKRGLIDGYTIDADNMSRVNIGLWRKGWRIGGDGPNRKKAIVNALAQLAKEIGND